MLRVVLLLVTWTICASAWEFTLYEHANHGGRSCIVRGNPSDCFPLHQVFLTDPRGKKQPVPATDAVSSVQNHGECTRFYADDNCLEVIGFVNPNQPCNSFRNPDCPINDKARAVSSCHLDVCQRQAANTTNVRDMFPFSAWATCIPDWEVTLYEHTHYGGRQVAVLANPQECFPLSKVSLTDPARKKPSMPATGEVSSVRADGECVRFYTDDECLYPIGFVDHTRPCSSFGTHNCPPNDKARAVSSCSRETCQRHAAAYAATVTESTRPHTELKRKRRQPGFSSHTIRSGDEVTIISDIRNGIIIPVMITVALHTNRLSPPSRGFGAQHNARLHDLGAVGGDERGHIIGRQLGGPSQNWNLLPQSLRLNRGNGNQPTWRTTENTIERWLQYHCHWVEWRLELQYPAGSTRPYRFDLYIEYWEHVNHQSRMAYDTYLECYNNAQGTCYLVHHNVHHNGR
jgi:hypothetical protein